MAKRSLDEIFAQQAPQPQKRSLDEIFSQEQAVAPQEVPIEDPAQDVLPYHTPEAIQEAKDRTKAAITGAAQGVSFGYADELKSALTGRPIEEIRAEDEEIKKQFPVTSLVGDLAGGMLGGGAALKALKAPQYIAKGASLLSKAGRAGLVGAGLGATEGFGRGEGGLEDRAAQAGTSGLLGGALGGAMPLVGEGLLWAGEKIAPTMKGLAGKAGFTKTAKKALDKGTSFFDEADNRTWKSLQDVAQRSEDEGGKLGQFALQQFRETPDVVGGKMKTALGDKIFSNLDEAMMGAKQQSAPFYQKLSSVDDVTQFSLTDKVDDLNKILSATEIDDSIEKVMRLNPELLRKGPRHVDTLNAAKNALYQTDRQSATALNNALKESIPDYKNASAAWSGFKDIEGAEIGKKMLGTGTRVKDVERFMKTSNPIEQKTALTSFVEDFQEKLMSGKDTTSAIDSIKSQAFKDKLRLLVGDKQQADGIIDMLEKEAMKSQGFKNVYKAAEKRYPDLFVKGKADGGSGFSLREAGGDVLSAGRGEEQAANKFIQSLLSSGEEGLQSLATPSQQGTGLLGTLLSPVRTAAKPMAQSYGRGAGILSGMLMDKE